jgi:hypothetical protein
MTTQWTKTPPTEPGYYRFRVEEGMPIKVWEVRTVRRAGYEKEWVEVYRVTGEGWENIHVTNRGEWWPERVDNDPSLDEL